MIPANVLACPQTMALILRAQAGELSSVAYHAAWDDLSESEQAAYHPSAQVEEWMRLHWHELVPEAPTPAESPAVVPPAPQPPAVVQPPVLAKRWMMDFLAEFVRKGIITKAARVADVTRATVHNHLNADPEFARAFEDAKEERKDLIRLALTDRAIEGWQEPVYGRVGKDQEGVVGTQWKYDPGALRLLATTQLPEVRAAKEAAAGNVTIENNVSATASAAIAVLTAPAKLKRLQERKRRQNERAAQRTQIIRT